MRMLLLSKKNKKKQNSETEPKTRFHYTVKGENTYIFQSISLAKTM